MIERHVQASLKPSEYAIYAFIADRTLRFGKQWERITVSNIVNGQKDSNNRWIHRGINMEERQVYRVLPALVNNGHVLKRAWGQYGNANAYAINLESDLSAGYTNSITMQNADDPDPQTIDSDEDAE